MMKVMPIKEMSRERLEVEYLNLLAITELKDDQLAAEDRTIRRLEVEIERLKHDNKQLGEQWKFWRDWITEASDILSGDAVPDEEDKETER